MLLGVTRGVRLARVAQVLDDLGLLVDDAVPTMRSWIEDRCQALPAGFRTEVRAWLLVLGRRRTRPTAVGLDDLRLLRARSAASPRLVINRGQLREVTEDDVCLVLDQVRDTALRARSSRCSRCSGSPSATA